MRKGRAVPSIFPGRGHTQIRVDLLKQVNRPVMLLLTHFVLGIGVYWISYIVRYSECRIQIHFCSALNFLWLFFGLSRVAGSPTNSSHILHSHTLFWLLVVCKECFLQFHRHPVDQSYVLHLFQTLVPCSVQNRTGTWTMWRLNRLKVWRFVTCLPVPCLPLSMNPWRQFCSWMSVNVFVEEWANCLVIHARTHARTHTRTRTRTCGGCWGMPQVRRAKCHF